MEIRLEHVETGRNLHTHDFQSPLSRKQEVSAFGEEGEGDSLDNWRINCEAPTPSGIWMRASKVALQSPVMGSYLHTHSSALFDSRNCPGCPIIGQQEVSAVPRPSSAAHWFADKGIFLTED